MLVQNKQSKEYYAMKILDKQKVRERKREREIIYTVKLAYNVNK